MNILKKWLVFIIIFYCLYLIRNFSLFPIICGIIFPISFIKTINYTKKELKNKINKNDILLENNNNLTTNKTIDKTISYPYKTNYSKNRDKILTKKW